jgi:hypothetical protein
MRRPSFRKRVFQRSRLISTPFLVSMPKTAFFANQSDQDMVGLLTSDYLQSSGWLESIRTRQPLRGGKPIPWFTYPAIEFFDSMVLEGKSVLEVGSGFSTLYWAQRGCRGVSLEIDPEWANSLSQTLSGIADSDLISVINVSDSLLKPRLRARDFLDSQQVEKLTAIPENEFPEESLIMIENETTIIDSLVNHLPNCDLFVVDGVARNLCLMMADKLCKDSVLIVLDNSDRIDYLTGRDFLVSRGWEPTIFTGLGPINPYQWSTTVFRKR